MKIVNLSVDRPVAILMVIFIIIVLGIISVFRIPREMMPDITYPVVTVITRYSGVSPEDVENMVTRPIEEAVSTVNNVKKVSSVSSEGLSMTTVELEWGTNLDFAAQDMRDRIDLVADFLPDDISRPIVYKFDLSMMPAIYYAVTAEKMAPVQFRTYVEDTIKDQIEQVDGVAAVMVYGGREREIQVKVDRSKLAAYGLSINQLVQVLQFGNLNLPAGHIVERREEYLLRTIGQYSSLDELRRTVVTAYQGAPIRLVDVAEVIDHTKEVRGFARANEVEGVVVIVSKQSGANTVEVVDAVKKRWGELEKQFPEGIKSYTVFDQGKIVSRVTSRTASSGIWGAILAIIVLYLFLRNFRPTFAIAVAIPLSIATTFIPIYFAGYTLNIMTLAGLALGVGMLVDNAVVVIESVFRHLEEGEGRIEAAKNGASEVGMAITSSTLTTMIVFLPLIFIKGIAGKLSQGLALTIAFALFASLFVALTIVPMIASKLFSRRVGGSRKRVSAGESRFWGRFMDGYRSFLASVLRHRALAIVVVGVVFIGTVVLGYFMPREFVPPSDNEFVMFKVSLPVGAPLEETDKVVKMVEDTIRLQEGVDMVASMLGTSEMTQGDPTSPEGVNEAMMMVQLKEKSERKRSSMQIQEDIRKALPVISGVKWEFFDMSRMMSGGGAAQKPINIKIFGKDLNTLSQIAEEIKTAIKDVRGVYDIESSLQKAKPELHIQPDRTVASLRALTVGQIATAMQTSMDGQVATRYREAGDEVDVRVELQDEDTKTLNEVKQTFIASPLGTQVRLGEVTKIEAAKGPVKLTRENRKRTISVGANISGRDLGGAMKEIQSILKKMQLPSGYFTEYGGEYEQMMETIIALLIALLLAILLIYMVMAALFESLVHPLTVMFTLPLGIIGVLLALFMTGTSISMTSLMGVLILFGIVVNNAIVLVDYVNQLRKRGMERSEAIVRGASIRLRPILITAFTTILGLVPMAIDRAEGAEMRAPMAISLIGGLLVATILTLVVIPVIYSIMDDISRRVSRKAVELVHGDEG
ncbi:efflux RND transporter permease subunit [Candidatus Poribacteria bacterium]|nr:efflux RND transporter permease subunit [Candidatus Poribacteria bacterium]